MRPREIMGGETRASFGIIVSFQNADGDRLTLYENGSLKDALRSLCERALAVDDTFRVTAISSPSSIYRDMQQRKRTTGSRRTAGTARASIPEPSQLGLIDMGWMLHPSLMGSRPKHRPN